MIELRILAGAEERVLGQVKLIALRFPGEHDLKVIVESWSGGPRRRESVLTLGPEWRCDGSGPCLAALREFGNAELSDALG